MSAGVLMPFPSKVFIFSVTRCVYMNTHTHKHVPKSAMSRDTRGASDSLELELEGVGPPHTGLGMELRSFDRIANAINLKQSF